MRIRPSNDRFYDLFGQAAQNLVSGAALLTDLCAAQPEDRVEIANRLRAVEHAGDDVTHGIIEQLDRSFVTPFDREDIYRLAIRLDDVLDFMEAAADLTVLYKVETLPAGVSEQIALLGEAAKLTVEVVPRLKGLRDLVPYWTQINELENKADVVYRSLLGHLFGGDFDTLTVLKLKEIVDQLEFAADAFEHLADVLHTVAVKES